MKRFFVSIVFISLLCHSVSAQQAVNLETALKNTAEYFAGRLPVGSRVIVLNITSRHAELSDYIINEMTMHFYNNGNFMMVDRQNLEAIRKELNFQYSGDVSDESMVSIGKMLGAQSIISGNITQVGDTYRLQVRAIAVETAAIQGMQSSNIVIDRMMATLTGTTPTQAMLDEEKIKLEGKNVFAFSLLGAYLPEEGFSGGATITVFEKHYKKIAPSVFITGKYAFFRPDNYDANFDYHPEAQIFALGGGILLKYRVTDRFIFNAGPSLELLLPITLGVTDRFDTPSALLGMGIQGGLSYRVHPNISLDINGIVKFGFSSWEVKNRFKQFDEPERILIYNPFYGGVELGVTFMFPYGGKR